MTDWVLIIVAMAFGGSNGGAGVHVKTIEGFSEQSCAEAKKSIDDVKSYGIKTFCVKK